MKQTSSALTFLLAQYRAIFKRAYIKGIASAVILTAGLAAGQAQAADAPNGSYWYTTDGTTWTEKKDVGSTFNNAERIAGDYDDGTTEGHNSGSVSGEKLVIGTSGDFLGINSGSVYGGYVKLGDDKTMNALAEDNRLTVTSGATINTTTGNLVGGWAKTNGSGVAIARDNKLIIDNSTGGITFTDANQFIGGVAAGNNGATAESNLLQFTGESGSRTELKNDGNFGATIFVGELQGKAGLKGTFEALGNTLEMSNFSISSATANTKQKTFVGGNIQILNLNENNSITLRAQGNTVDLSNFTIGNASYVEDTTNGNVGNIAANYVVNNEESTKHAVALVEANGSGDTGVILNNGDIFGASVYGGFAQNVSGGSATASNNSVSITNTDLFVSTSGSASSQKYIMNAVTGGHAESTYTTAGQKVNLNASNNVVSIVNDENDKAKTPHTMQGTVYGAKLTLTSGSASGINHFSGASLTADGNQVTVGEGIDVIDGSIYGAYLESNVGTTTESGGATLHASNNSVTIDGSWTFSDNASIATVAAEAGMLTAENNKLVLNGKVNGGGAVIAAVVSSAQPKITGTLDNPGVHQLSNNSVEIGATAEIENANIYAAQSLAHSAYTLNNDVTVAGKVTNSGA